MIIRVTSININDMRRLSDAGYTVVIVDTKSLAKRQPPDYAYPKAKFIRLQDSGARKPLEGIAAVNQPCQVCGHVVCKVH